MPMPILVASLSPAVCEVELFGKLDGDELVAVALELEDTEDRNVSVVAVLVEPGGVEKIGELVYIGSPTEG